MNCHRYKKAVGVTIAWAGLIQRICVIRRGEGCSTQAHSSFLKDACTLLPTIIITRFGERKTRKQNMQCIPCSLRDKRTFDTAICYIVELENRERGLNAVEVRLWHLTRDRYSAESRKYKDYHTGNCRPGSDTGCSSYYATLHQRSRQLPRMLMQRSTFSFRRYRVDGWSPDRFPLANIKWISDHLIAQNK